ncbi:MAG: UDP-N-acetylmuramoyl-L-alanine--D-glutamate ligase, partial [Aeromonadaceae bacterium]|nr:UDP-N-acetylmuramoyl-L-alanine--D-glutamate ligase [Aeromonadaceae bacterium]
MAKVVIIGLGKTGLSCVAYFLARGVTPTVLDTRAQPPGRDALPAQVPLISGPLDASLLCQADLIVS